MPSASTIWLIARTLTRAIADACSGVTIVACAPHAEHHCCDAAGRKLTNVISSNSIVISVRFFTPLTAASLPEAISYSGRGVTVVEERELWDMPALFLALVGLVAAEWGYRRMRGLA